ncbi:MAG: exo-beta-N-acetylmuramidase NamZ domain-containing protein, partial [Verrucomicrobiota bacterium]
GIDRIAPTEELAGPVLLRGVVHDPTARRLGGVAGHAGLFTSADDLARFSRMLLNGGTLEGRTILRPETVRQMIAVQTPPGLPRRGLGWDIDSPYAGPRGSVFPLGSYGHTGWTGTSLWIDPFSRTFLIFLSNRNHPTEEGNVVALRRELGTLAAEAVESFNFVGVPGALPPAPASTNGVTTTAGPTQTEVLNGIDVLVRDNFRPLQGLRVGLVTNQTGRDRQRRPTIDLLRAATNLQLVALFSPEHGIRGALDQEKIGDTTDPVSGLPVYSLYGERRAPSPEQLAPLDAVVFDIQDIGCRFYTYISTLGNCLEATARAGKRLIVLDRINPITGRVEGPISSGERSFVAWHEIPLRHGMTVGELARLFNAERKLNARLEVIRVEGWTPSQWMDQTGLPWVNPSPNMRSLTEATLYPGVGLLEFCAVSVGRGTGTPFEVLGAPYIDDLTLAAELNRAGLPGVRFLPIRFTPTGSVFAGKDCGGVQILLTDRSQFRAADLGVLLATTLQRRYPDQLQLDRMSRLLMSPTVLEAIKAGSALGDIRALWNGAVTQFESRRKEHLLYPRGS